MKTTDDTRISAAIVNIHPTPVVVEETPDLGTLDVVSTHYSEAGAVRRWRQCSEPDALFVVHVLENYIQKECWLLTCRPLRHECKTEAQDVVAR